MLSGCVNSHPFTGMAYCVKAIGLYPYWGKCIHIGVGFDVVHSKMIFLICYLLDYQQVHDNANVSIILLGDKKEPTK